MRRRAQESAEKAYRLDNSKHLQKLKSMASVRDVDVTFAATKANNNTSSKASRTKSSWGANAHRATSRVFTSGAGKDDNSNHGGCMSVPPTARLSSHAAFSWATGVMRAGWRHTLTEADIGAALGVDSAERNGERLGKCFYADAKKGKDKSKPSLMKTYFRVYGLHYFCMGAFFRLFWVLIVVAQILALRIIIAFVEQEYLVANASGQDNITTPAPTVSDGFNNTAGGSVDGVTTSGEGAAAVALLSICCFLQPLFINHLFFWSYRFGARARAGTSALIWKKAGRMSVAALHGSKGSEVLNLAEVDTNRICEGFRYGHFCWTWLFELSFATAFLYKELGVASLSGVAVILLAIPLQGKFAGLIGKIQSKIVKFTDSRIRLMKQIIQGIELVKVNAWEKPFAKKVESVRSREVGKFRKAEALKAMNQSIFQAAPLVAAALTFTIKTVALGETLEASNAFAALSWFNLILRTLIMVPRGFQHFSEMLVSAKRVSDFLSDDNEIDPIPVTGEKDANDSRLTIRLEECAFSWKRESQCTLRCVSLELKSSELLVVIGEIGSGKSSLLSALCGEMYLERGTFSKHVGRHVLVPQHAFILNATVMENITFGLEYDEALFESVVHACCLSEDIDSMPGGAFTDIGEKGVTLSGGQRQRIGLARGVYCTLHSKDPTIILCDDILSALDNSVAATLFARVFSSKQGILRKSSVSICLVTHATWCCKHADAVLVLNDGAGASETTSDVNLDALSPSSAGDRKTVLSEDQPLPDADALVSSPESSAVGGVSAEVFSRYMTAGGGKYHALWILVLYILTQILRIMCDWWVGEWAENGLSFENKTYAIGYFVGVFTFCIFVFSRGLILTYAMLHASTNLHNEMFKCILGAPMSWWCKYF